MENFRQNSDALLEGDVLKENKILDEKSRQMIDCCISVTPNVANSKTISSDYVANIDTSLSNSLSGERNDINCISGFKKDLHWNDTFDEELSDEETNSYNSKKLHDVDEGSVVENSGKNGELYDKDSEEINSDHSTNLHNDEDSLVADSDKREASTEAVSNTKKFLKQKEEELIKIYSESQRRTRESSLSLPYHTTPKITLEHFLNRRRQRELMNTNNFLKNVPKLFDQLIDTHLHSKQDDTDESEKPVLCNNFVTSKESSDMVTSEAVRIPSFTAEKFSIKCNDYSDSENSSLITDFKLNNSDSYLHLMNGKIEVKSKDISLVHNETTELCNLSKPNEVQLNDSTSEPSDITSQDDCNVINEALSEQNEQSLKSDCAYLEHPSYSNELAILENNDSEAHKENDFLKETKKKNKFIALETKDTDAVNYFKPHIRGEPNSTIDLNEYVSKSPQKNGIEQFIERFMQHSKPYKCLRKSEVKLNIVQRKQENGKVELMNNLVTFNVPSVEEDNPALKTPGARLACLKEQLWSKIKTRQKEAMDKRRILHDMDNEFVNLEEDEAELTESSEGEAADDEDDDSDVEEEDMHTDSEEDAEISGKEYRRKRNEFLDDEAEEEDSESNFSEEENCTVKFETIKDVISNSECKKESYLHNESDAAHNLPHLFSSANSNNNSSIIKDSCELLGSIIPAYQPVKNVLNEKLESSLDDAEPSHHKVSSASVTTQSAEFGGISQCLWPSQNFSFSPLASLSAQDWSNLHSKTGHFECESSDMKKLLGDSSGQESFNEVLALCSGKFSCTSSDNPLSNFCKEKDLGTSQSSTQENMKELLDMCSGQFLASTSVENESSKDSFDMKRSKSHPRKLILSDDDDDTSILNKSESEFGDDKYDDESTAIQSELDKETVVENELNDVNYSNAFTGFTNKKGHILKEFLEEEAELSGSDVGSDDDYDIAEENDELEELPILEDLPSEDELRNQIGRVHLKTILDEDKQELRLFKEMYLEDGELHSDQVRERKFRWKNIGNEERENTRFSDSENDVDVEEDEKWRIERFEREKWLQEQAVKGEHILQSPMKESRKKGSVSFEIINSASGTVLSDTFQGNSSPSDFLVNPQNYLKKCPGSYLTRGKNYLACLAQKMKSTDDSSAGSRTTKHFVFRAVSPQKSRAKVITSPNNQSLYSPLQPRKRRKLKEAVKHGSVFDYLE